MIVHSPSSQGLPSKATHQISVAIPRDLQFDTLIFASKFSAFTGDPWINKASGSNALQSDRTAQLTHAQKIRQ